MDENSAIALKMLEIYYSNASDQVKRKSTLADVVNSYMYILKRLDRQDLELDIIESLVLEHEQILKSKFSDMDD